jgi:hypothetical protein
MAQTSAIPGLPAGRRTLRADIAPSIICASLHGEGHLPYAVHLWEVSSRPTVLNACATCEKIDASHQTIGQIIRSGPCFGTHRGAGNRLDASRQGARSAHRAAVRRRRRSRVRQGPVVRTSRGKMCLPVRPAIRHPIGRTTRDMRGRAQALHCPQAQQEFPTGLWLQQQNLFERLLPPCLSDRQISRWKVLMHARWRAECDPLFRHIIAYKLPLSCFAGAGLPAPTKAR